MRTDGRTIGVGFVQNKGGAICPRHLKVRQSRGLQRCQRSRQDCQAGSAVGGTLPAVAIVAGGEAILRDLMSLEMRWVGEADLDRVAETRVLCYAHHKQELAEWRKYIHNQGRSVAGDYLLAERDGVAVGTATSLRMTMWVRGAPIS